MKNVSILSKLFLLLTLVLPCGQAFGMKNISKNISNRITQGIVSSVRDTAKAFWKSEPVRVAKYTAGGSIVGIGAFGSYFAYKGGLEGNLLKTVLWGGLFGGTMGFACSQLWGVKRDLRVIKCDVRDMKKLVSKLQKETEKLTKQEGKHYEANRKKLIDIAKQLETVATKNQLDNFKQELKKIIQSLTEKNNKQVIMGNETHKKIDEIYNAVNRRGLLDRIFS